MHTYGLSQGEQSVRRLPDYYFCELTKSIYLQILTSIEYFTKAYWEWAALPIGKRNCETTLGEN